MVCLDGFRANSRPRNSRRLDWTAIDGKREASPATRLRRGRQPATVTLFTQPSALFRISGFQPWDTIRRLTKRFPSLTVRIAFSNSPPASILVT